MRRFAWRRPILCFSTSIKFLWKNDPWRQSAHRMKNYLKHNLSLFCTICVSASFLVLKTSDNSFHPGYSPFLPVLLISWVYPLGRRLGRSLHSVFVVVLRVFWLLFRTPACPRIRSSYLVVEYLGMFLAGYSVSSSGPYPYHRTIYRHLRPWRLCPTIVFIAYFVCGFARWRLHLLTIDHFVDVA